MIVIDTTELTDASVISANVPEDDFALFDAATTYNKGDKVTLTSTHKNYECEADSVVGIAPNVGLDKWLDLGATNRFAMLDGKNLTKTRQAGSLEYSFKPGGIINAIGLLGVRAKTVQVVVTDDVYGIVYDHSFDMADYAANGLYDYFFTEPTHIDKLILTDLPPYRNAIIKVIVSEESSAEVATLLMGSQVVIGELNWGFKAGINDYSSVSFDAFGESTLIQRGYANTVDVALSIPTTQVSFIKNKLASMRAKKVLWVGHENHPESIVYGIFNSFSIVIPNLVTSKCNLSIKGAV